MSETTLSTEDRARLTEARDGVAAMLKQERAENPVLGESHASTVDNLTTVLATLDGILAENH